MLASRWSNLKEVAQQEAANPSSIFVHDTSLPVQPIVVTLHTIVRVLMWLWSCHAHIARRVAVDKHSFFHAGHSLLNQVELWAAGPRYVIIGAGRMDHYASSHAACISLGSISLQPVRRPRRPLRMNGHSWIHRSGSSRLCHACLVKASICLAKSSRVIQASNAERLTSRALAELRGKMIAGGWFSCRPAAHPAAPPAKHSLEGAALQIVSFSVSMDHFQARCMLRACFRLHPCSAGDVQVDRVL